MTGQHELVPAKKLRYPGGKDGMYQAGCICGRPFGVYANPGRAERAVLDHIRDKMRGSRAQ